MDEYLKAGASYLRLHKEYEKYGSLVIGVDFDGTLYDYHKTGQTYDNVIQLVKDLKSIGCKIIIWTAQADHALVETYLKDKEIPFDGINTDGVPLNYETRKPFFSALLDDRAGLKQAYEELSMLVFTIKMQKSHDEDRVFRHRWGTSDR